MKRIQIIDDDLRHDKMITYLLLSKGFDVKYFTSGHDALQSLKKNKDDRPDLIILDIMMPHMDGFETFTGIRNGGGINIPIIFMSALSDPRTKEKALNMGAVDYINKPFHPSELVERIQKITEVN